MRDGGLAVVSHSGSACIALSTLGRFGLSYLVSVGNAAVLDVADYLEYLAADSETKTVALFVETLRDPAAFARAMRAIHDAGKSVVALKVGRSASGAAASAAHTGSLAGNWDAYQAYFRRHGVIAVDDFDELAESVELALKIHVPPQGDGVAVIAVSGGEASLVAGLAERADVRLPDLAPETAARLGRYCLFSAISATRSTPLTAAYTTPRIFTAERSARWPTNRRYRSSPWCRIARRACRPWRRTTTDASPRPSPIPRAT